MPNPRDIMEANAKILSKRLQKRLEQKPEIVISEFDHFYFGGDPFLDRMIMSERERFRGSMMQAASVAYRAPTNFPINNIDSPNPPLLFTNSEYLLKERCFWDIPIVKAPLPDFLKKSKEEFYINRFPLKGKNDKF